NSTYHLLNRLTYLLKQKTYLSPDWSLQTGCTPPSAPVSLPGRLGASGRQVWCNPYGMHNRGQRMVYDRAVLYPGFRAGL
ncbi:hypothetical protein, partial [Eubacterium sp. am_0171]|uniref:hypothetical protein n=1 Tax=Eubacterium sp. am_0171 TaxID=2478955 RepID=UPI001A9B643C